MRTADKRSTTQATFCLHRSADDEPFCMGEIHKKHSLDLHIGDTVIDKFYEEIDKSNVDESN